jgi:hypothetical protein
MAFFEDLVKGNLVTSLIVGAGVIVLGPILVPAVARVARPAAKAAVKAGIMVFERGQEAVAEIREMAEDVHAEARAELGQRAEHAAAAAQGPARKAATRPRRRATRPT